jgi:hypothetical protein
MNLIPLDARLVRGSHGRAPADSAHAPLFITSSPDALATGTIGPTDVLPTLLSHLF